MPDNPYASPATVNLEPPVLPDFTIEAGIVGGLAAVALSAMGGTLKANLLVWWYMAMGDSMHDAYAKLWEGVASPGESF